MYRFYFKSAGAYPSICFSLWSNRGMSGIGRIKFSWKLCLWKRLIGRVSGYVIHRKSWLEFTEKSCRISEHRWNWWEVEKYVLENIGSAYLTYLPSVRDRLPIFLGEKRDQTILVCCECPHNVSSKSWAKLLQLCIVWWSWLYCFSRHDLPSIVLCKHWHTYFIFDLRHFQSILSK